MIPTEAASRAHGGRAARVLALALLAIGFPTGCHEDGVQPRENYVEVRLSDSLARYDSVEVLVLAGIDTSEVIGRAWAGPLPDPAGLPPFRLPEGEGPGVSIRVRAFDGGKLALDQLLTKEAGAQKVASLLPPVPVPVDTGKPVDTLRPPVPRPSTRLKSLAILPGVLEPAFDSSITDYAVTLAPSEGAVTLTAVPVADSATVRVEGVKVKAGAASDPIAMRMGQNEIAVRVNAGDSSRIYTVRAVRTAKPATDTGTAGLPGFPGFPDWRFKATVGVDVLSLGLGPGTVRSFPLLVRLNRDNFPFAEAAPGGRDLRFARGGVALKHEIARWDTAGEVGEAWVLLDSLRTDAPFPSLDLYWGNPAAAAVSDPAGVFYPGTGFNAAWHFAESGRGEAGEYRDATGRYHGTAGPGAGSGTAATPLPPRRVEGVVGYGQSFRFGGKPGTIVIPPAFDPGPQWSLQMWIRTDAVGRGTLFRKAEGPTVSRHRFEIRTSDNPLQQVGLHREGSEYASGVYLPRYNWVHLAMVNDGAAVGIYVDGILRETAAWTQGTSAAGTSVFGALTEDGSFNNFDGSLDEVWFSTGGRSAAWLRLAFENQRPLSDLVTVERP